MSKNAFDVQLFTSNDSSRDYLNINTENILKYKMQLKKNVCLYNNVFKQKPRGKAYDLYSTNAYYTELNGKCTKCLCNLLKRSQDTFFFKVFNRIWF